MPFQPNLRFKLSEISRSYVSMYFLLLCECFPRKKFQEYLMSAASNHAFRVSSGIFAIMDGFHSFSDWGAAIHYFPDFFVPIFFFVVESHNLQRIFGGGYLLQS